ncbi:hypothetical protein SORBI_3009G099850 [Sorghum bicolor]|uniref:Uncharacterized protein n=1 Tax=Sorghum bicolor TaxID=4558 RepID=A0A1Z5R1W8_SORBI|nr:hypothetical protein SORBI_3009G099850 [Sorghum bicolor]
MAVSHRGHVLLGSTAGRLLDAATFCPATKRHGGYVLPSDTTARQGCVGHVLPRPCGGTAAWRLWCGCLPWQYLVTSTFEICSNLLWSKCPLTSDCVCGLLASR